MEVPDPISHKARASLSSYALGIHESLLRGLLMPHGSGTHSQPHVRIIRWLIRIDEAPPQTKSPESVEQVLGISLYCTSSWDARVENQGWWQCDTNISPGVLPFCTWAQNGRGGPSGVWKLGWGPASKKCVWFLIFKTMQISGVCLR